MQQYQALLARTEHDSKTVIEIKTQLAAAILKLAITEESLREVTAQNRMLVKTNGYLSKNELHLKSWMCKLCHRSVVSWHES